MSGRNGWMKFQSPGRPATPPELERCPDAWWAKPEYQERAAFVEKARVEQARMARRGLSPDRLVFDQ